MKAPAIILFGFLLGQLCGCLALQDTDLFPCKTDSDCTGSKRCLTGVDGAFCRHAIRCRSSNDCFRGQTCVNEQCTPPRCNLDDSVCGNYACNNYYEVCETQCYFQRDCKSGFGCARRQCLDCTPTESNPCGECGDTDGDGACDHLDKCPLDAKDDSDGDGLCDSNDPCPNASPDDSDRDGVCDNVDACPEHDNRQDSDSDGVPDGCDTCPGDTDEDRDSICDSVDRCPVADNSGDTDGSGYPDACEVVLGEYHGAITEETYYNPSGTVAESGTHISYYLHYEEGSGNPSRCSSLSFGQDRKWYDDRPGVETFNIIKDPSLKPVLECLTDGISEKMKTVILEGNLGITAFPGSITPESTLFGVSPDFKNKHVTYLRLIVDDIYVYYRANVSTKTLLYTHYRWQVLGYQP